MVEQVALKNAIYMSGSSQEVKAHLRALLNMYGDIAVIDLLKLLQQ